jgi:ABC-type glycerol-3-phosphate transport system substrate-binding protein
MKIRTSLPATRRRRFKTLSGVFVSMLAIGGLAACGSSGGNNSTSSGNGKVTLTLFQCQTCVPFPWQISAFEKAYPKIHINVNSVPFGEFYTKTAVLAASSSPPDLYTVDQPTIANLAAGQVIQPLDKYLSSTYVQSMTAAARADFTYNGKLYSPGPIDTSLALYYNQTLLTKAGITPPTSLATAWTWPQAEAAMAKCQKANSSGGTTVWGLAPTTFGNGTPGFDYISMLFLRSEGAKSGSAGGLKTFQAISPNGSTVDGYINSPQAVQGATFYQDIFQKFKISPTTGIPNAFLDGKACFDMNTSNDIDTINAAKVSFKWGVTAWPHFQSPIVHNGSTEIAIGSKTTHLAQAVQFIKFISSPAQQEEMVTQTGYLPVISSLYQTDHILTTAPWNIFASQLDQWGEPRPVTPHYLQYSQVVTNALRDIADGSAPKARLDQAVQQLDQLLAQPAGAL